MTTLNTLEIAILRVMRDSRPRASVTIADEADQPGWAARATLKALRRLRLVTQEWSLRDGLPGSWRITELGAERLREYEQLRLVP